jgi:hypothetical protein
VTTCVTVYVHISNNQGRNPHQREGSLVHSHAYPLLMDILADYTDSDSEEEDDEVAFYCGFAVGMTISCYSSRFDKLPLHTSMLSGQQWLDELLSGHDMRFYNELGMQTNVFKRLLGVLETGAGLRGTRHVSAAEQLAIFLHYACRGLSNRALQERFQRSSDTITK